MFWLILSISEVPLTHEQAARIAFVIIFFAISLNIINDLWLRSKIFRINKELKKEISDLKKRLHKWEQDCP